MSYAVEFNRVRGFKASPGRDGSRVIEVDTKKAEYRGRPYNRMDDHERLKYENLLVLDRDEFPVHILYDGSKKPKGNPR